MLLKTMSIVKLDIAGHSAPVLNAAAIDLTAAVVFSRRFQVHTFVSCVRVCWQAASSNTVAGVKV